MTKSLAAALLAQLREVNFLLRAQAQDVRDTAKRDLMESAGKKEIAMMIPVVFGVLPLTVVFAVYPGLAAISMGL